MQGRFYWTVDWRRFLSAVMQRFATNADGLHMIEHSSITSRRELLAAIAITPVAMASPWDAAIAALPYHDEPVVLRRTRSGRRDSRFRYHNAESFFLGIERGIVRHPHDQLYQAGIVSQLGISSHLFDVGFTDQWCARHIGLNVTRSLAYANASGFGFELTEFDLLAAILSPYGRWRFPQPSEQVEALPFTPEQIRTLTRALLDHVHHVTGNPRPRGWSARYA